MVGDHHIQPCVYSSSSSSHLHLSLFPHLSNWVSLNSCSAIAADVPSLDIPCNRFVLLLIHSNIRWGVDTTLASMLRLIIIFFILSVDSPWSPSHFANLGSVTLPKVGGQLVVKCCCMCQTGSFLLSLLVANEEWHATTPGTTTVYSVQLQKINGEPHSDYFLVNFM